MKERTFTANGLVLNCVDYGGEGKPPILFLHGGSAHGHWWDFIAPHFTDRFHALALDQRGHGESQWPEEWGYGTRHYVSDLDQVLDQWGLGAPVLVGHSMGGHNVLVYASLHPQKLRAMVAIDSPPIYSEMAVSFLRSLAEKPGRRYASKEEAVENFRVLPRETIAKKEILDYVAHRSFKQTAEGEWIHKIDRRTMIREPLDIWDDLAKIACPALFIKIKKSPIVPIETAQKMVAMMPRGKLAEIDDSYHHVMFDNPTALIAALDQFVRGLSL